MRLEGNTVLVTGGSSGIGLALARAFKETGNTVVICGRNSQKLDDVQRRFPGIETRQVDLSQPSQLASFAEELCTSFPELNLLVNNAGIQRRIDFNDGRDHTRAIRQEIEVNLTSHISLTDLLLPKILGQPEGAVVNVTSALAIAPKRSAPVYCVTKAAMRAFSRVLRYQLDGSNVKVFEIIPALVESAMTANRGDKHLITPEYVARATLAGMKINRGEIAIERARLLLFLHRLWPGLAYRILKNE